MTSTGTVVFTFDTTHAAMWAEEIAQARSLVVEVVPAPAAARARCNLALLVRQTSAPTLARALDEEGVSFRIWSAPSDGALPRPPRLRR